MPATSHAIMQRLYGCDIWQGFVPEPAGAGVQGWNGDHPSLRRVAATNAPKVVIDVGVWKGQSTITMAAALRDARIDGCVIAVDTFLGSREHWSGGNGQYFERTHGMPNLYRTFLGNVWSAGLQDYVVPLPQTSISAAAILLDNHVSASVVHIDAAHEYAEVLRDATDYWAIVAPGGCLIGDDYHPTWPGVVRAAGEFAALVAVPLTIEPPKWILQKPEPS